MNNRKFLLLVLLIVLLLIAVGCNSKSASFEYPNLKDDKIIEYKHIKSGQTENYGAVILYEYKMDNYTKYQVSFLSCTCRAASENYQHMMYIEINNNNNSPEEATIRDIKFQFWGDSPVNPENGITYENIEKEFLPYLRYKSKVEIDAMTSLRDIKDADKVERNGQMYDFIDGYSGATVSVDNTLAILHALFNYHVNKYYK